MTENEKTISPESRYTKVLNAMVERKRRVNRIMKKHQRFNKVVRGINQRNALYAKLFKGDASVNSNGK